MNSIDLILEMSNDFIESLLVHVNFEDMLIASTVCKVLHFNLHDGIFIYLSLSILQVPAFQNNESIDIIIH